MISRLWERNKSTKSSVAASVAIHIVLFAALATVTFHYPLAAIFDKPEVMKPVAVLR